MQPEARARIIARFSWLTEFTEKGLADCLKDIKKVAALLTHQEVSDIAEWDVSQTQEAAKLVLTVMESAVFGPAMGAN